MTQPAEARAKAPGRGRQEQWGGQEGPGHKAAALVVWRARAK